LARNHYVRGGEVDIIFEHDGVTVFCEVKLRSNTHFGTGAEAVTVVKQRRICRAALDYAFKNKIIDERLRFDIIEIAGGKINHIKNAFEFIQPAGV
jgi:putative endonuclease